MNHAYHFENHRGSLCSGADAHCGGALVPLLHSGGGVLAGVYGFRPAGGLRLFRRAAYRVYRHAGVGVPCFPLWAPGHRALAAGSSVRNFKDFQGIDALAQGVKDAFGGHAADFAFQCTGSPIAHANIYKFIRNGGGLCELGFFINGGDATINPHFDLCSKEITLVGSWVYTLRDYATTFDFLKRAKAIGLPMDDLITHEFPLEQINEAHQTNLAMKGLKIAIINK